MSKIVTVTEDMAMKLALEGNAVILGGVEVHVHFVRYKGDPGIVVEFLPPYGTDDVPDWMDDIDKRLAGLCRQTVMNSKPDGFSSLGFSILDNSKTFWSSRGSGTGPSPTCPTTRGTGCSTSQKRTAARTG
ncbi:MAG: hypothetical protein A4E35_01032 [Methanoregula sp. PtaU1.Bin051]|nr:MAG: hypothetical protein A4E35_01032 [Methanoregula sp. PtaU1.Bin051]